jgi:hypothetical protein
MIEIQKKEVKTVPPLNELILLLYGSPGSGKTKLCDGIPGVLFIATEPGHDFTTSPVFQCTDWKGFRELITHLQKMRAAGKPEYGTFVIDIVDNLITFCRDFICKRKNLAYPPTNDFGKTWAEISTEWKDGLIELWKMGNIIFISHCTTREVEFLDENNMKIETDQHVPTFSGTKASQFLDGIVNAQGYLVCNAKGQHWITFRKTATIAAKDRTGILSAVQGINIDWSSGKNSWQNLNEAYINICEKLTLKIESRRRQT